MKKILLGTMLALAAGGAANVEAQRYYDRDDRYDYEYARYERCNSCGEVIDINRFYNDRGRKSSSSSGTGGAVVGAVIGGLLGNQVGSGSGRKAATVAGAVAGGVAGKRIAENRSGGGGDWYEVIVRMDTGRRVVLQQDELDGLDIGDRVAVRGGKARQI